MSGTVLLDPNNLLTAAQLDDARDLVDALMTVMDGDRLADLLEHCVDKTDRAHAVLFELLCRIRWPEMARGSGVEVVAQTQAGPRNAKLWVPS